MATNKTTTTTTTTNLLVTTTTNLLPQAQHCNIQSIFLHGRTMLFFCLEDYSPCAQAPCVVHAARCRGVDITCLILQSFSSRSIKRQSTFILSILKSWKFLFFFQKKKSSMVKSKSYVLELLYCTVLELLRTCQILYCIIIIEHDCRITLRRSPPQIC